MKTKDGAQRFYIVGDQPCLRSLLPVPCPQFPACQFPVPVSCPSSLSPLPVPSSLVCCLQFPAIQFPAPVLCPQFPVSSSLSQVPCLQFAASSSLSPVRCPSSLPSSLSQVPCLQFAATGTMERAHVVQETMEYTVQKRQKRW